MNMEILDRDSLVLALMQAPAVKLKSLLSNYDTDNMSLTKEKLEKAMLSNVDVLKKSLHANEATEAREIIREAITKVEAEKKRLKDEKVEKDDIFLQVCSECAENLTGILYKYSPKIGTFHYLIDDGSGELISLATDNPESIYNSLARFKGDRKTSTTVRATIKKVCSDIESVIKMAVDWSDRKVMQKILEMMKNSEDTHLPELPPILSNSPNVKDLCLRRLTLPQCETPEDLDTPSWDEFTNKMSYEHAEVFKAWVYSVFLAKDIGRQMLILQGEGNDGKTTVCKVLQEVIGPDIVGTINNKTIDSDFNADLIGKRLIIYWDCKKTDVVGSELIHGITGNDDISVNEKFEKRYRGNIYSKVLISTNEAVTFNNVVNEVSRVLFCRVIKPKDGVKPPRDSGFKSRLVAEFKDFICKCRVSYDVLCVDETIVYNVESLLKSQTVKSAQIDRLLTKEYEFSRECFSTAPTVKISLMVKKLRRYIEQEEGIPDKSIKLREELERAIKNKYPEVKLEYYQNGHEMYAVGLRIKPTESVEGDGGL